MTQATADTQAVRILRDIIEGDDTTMSRALAEGKEFLRVLKVAKARPGNGDELDRIMALVADHYGFTVTKLVDRERTQQLAQARQVAMWACRDITGAPFEVIGKKFNRDHGTVIHAGETVRNLRDTQTRFRADTDAIRQRAALMLGRKSA